jgi:hypothetical protein
MALAMARPWKHPKTGIYWLRKGVPEDLRAVIGKREEKFSLKTRDPAEAKILHAQALADLEQRWSNLKAPPKTLSEREAHELVAPAFEWWVNLHKDNPSEQKLWKTKFFDQLWEFHDPPVYKDDVPTLEAMRHDEEDGYFAKIRMQHFCHEQVNELLTKKGLRLDCLSEMRVSKAFAAAIQHASLHLEKVAGGELTALSSHPAMSHGQNRSNLEGVHKPIKFETLIEGWANERTPVKKTIYEYRRVLRDLATFLGHDDATKLTAQDLVAWKGKMIEANMHPKTIRDAKLAPLHAILQWAVDNHRLVLFCGLRPQPSSHRQCRLSITVFVDALSEWSSRQKSPRLT